MPHGVSLILPVGAGVEHLRVTLESLRGQSVTAETIAVVTTDQREATRRAAPELDAIVDLDASRWTLGRALNSGSATATSPVHATIAMGRRLPRADWLERLRAHFDRPDVMAASGAKRDRQLNLLFEPLELRVNDWSETLSFSTAAGGWRASALARCPFPETAPGAEDRIWAWEALRGGGVLVVDPFLQLQGPPLRSPTAWSIFERTAADWAGLVSFGTPVTAPTTLRDALAEWWTDIEEESATPALVQRLNYFRLARALGRWAGGRRARRFRRDSP
jgi:hypothetical protein